jgi:DNA-binding response OmpR family regulator
MISDPTATHSGKFRILIVEDSETQAMQLRWVLEKEGWEVGQATTAEQALQAISQRAPDLILVDYYLPGTRGDELCRRIRMNIDSRDIRIMMLTANETHDMELRGLDSGADDFFSKSTDIEILLLRIKGLLAKSQRQTAILGADDSSLRAARLLTIDDSPTYLEHLACELESEGYQVERALSGEEGLQRVRQSEFDCVLVDLIMPGIDGIEVCRLIDQLRKVEEVPVPILMLTSKENKEDLTRALEAGADDFVGKSSDSAVLKGRIRALLRRRCYAIQRQQLFKEIMGAKELLERKNERLAELYQTAHRFVDNVSHEFRTPLTVINEYTSLIRDGLVGPVTDEQARLLDIVSCRSDDLNTMVDDMLDVSRLEAGLLGASRKPCKVADIVENLRPALARKAAVKGVVLEIVLEEPLDDVYCDDEKVRRIIINLTVNAIKFCDEHGHAGLWAKKNPTAPGVIIGVTDTGPGIEEVDLKRIFDRFSQLDASVRDSCKGFGLGLSIAQDLVELNFGEMHVESKVGQGSTFSFTLPPNEPMEIMHAYLRRICQLHDPPPHVSLIKAQVDFPADASCVDGVDAYLQGLLRRNDLSFQAGDGRWILVIAGGEMELEEFYKNAAASVEHINRNRIRGALPKVAMDTAGIWNPASHTEKLVAQLSELLLGSPLAVAPNRSTRAELEPSGRHSAAINVS